MTNWIKTKDRVPEQQRPGDFLCYDPIAIVVEYVPQMSEGEPPYKEMQLATYSHYIGRWIKLDGSKVIDYSPDIVVTHWIRCKDLVDAAT